MDEERQRFEQWYATHALNHERDPIGSRDCGLQWAAWQAGSESHRAELAACRELGSAMENALNTIVVMDRRLSLREREEIATMRRKWFAARKGEGDK